jgi:hypothetical protein
MQRLYRYAATTKRIEIAEMLTNALRTILVGGCTS